VLRFLNPGFCKKVEKMGFEGFQRPNSKPFGWKVLNKVPSQSNQKTLMVIIGILNGKSQEFPSQKNPTQSKNVPQNPKCVKTKGKKGSKVQWNGKKRKRKVKKINPTS